MNNNNGPDDLSNAPEDKGKPTSRKKVERRSTRGKKRNFVYDTPSTTPLNVPKEDIFPIFTQDQARLLNLLADGLPHSKDELVRCLNDEFASWATVRMLLHRICLKIRVYGGDIIARLIGRKLYYQRVVVYNHRLSKN